MEYQTLTQEKETSQSIQTYQLIADFLSGLEAAGKSPNTVKNYKTDLECFKQFLVDKQKNTSIIDFNITKVKEYGHYLEQRYQSDNSRRRRVQTLRLFFDFLIGRGIYSENPVRKLVTSPKFVDLPRPAKLKEIIHLWNSLLNQESKTPIEKLINKRNQIIVSLIYSGCLKVSEIERLKKQHFSFTTRGARVLISPPKRDPYTIPLDKNFKHLYDDYVQLLNEISHIEFDDLLFNANPYRILKGGISARGLEMIFKDFTTKFNVEMTPKTLRQAGIFNWLHQGHEDGNIKEWLGLSPSYSLKPYKKMMDEAPYHGDFLYQ